MTGLGASRLALGAGAVLLAAAGIHLAILRLSSPPAAAPLDRLGTVPPFSFVSEQGETVTDKSLAGKVWVADFVFVRCGGSCPQMSARMALLAERLASEPRIRLISFDVDPEHDGIPQLLAYARGYGANPAQWSFLRGDAPAVRSLARDGFKMGVVDGNAGDPEPVIHSSHFVLVDSSQTIRGYYDPLAPASLDQLAADARRLAAGIR